MPQPPNFAPTPDAAVGLQCPYCQTPMGAGEPAAACGDCGITHHQECWAENQGCAVPGCESAPDPLAATTTVPAAEMAGATTSGASATNTRISIPVEDSPRRSGLGRRSAPQATAPSNFPPRARRSRRPLVVGLLLTLLLAGVVGVLLSSGGQSTIASTSSSTCPSSAPGSCTDLTVGGSKHSLTEAEVKEAVQDLLRRYYGALSLGTEEGRLRARQMLSASELTRLDSDDTASQQWERDAALIGEELEDASAARVTALVNRINRSQETGVARVKVAGMGWAGTGCTDGKFEGVTWAQHEGDAATGSWRLDPDPSSRLDSVDPGDVLGATCLAGSE